MKNRFRIALAAVAAGAFSLPALAQDKIVEFDDLEWRVGEDRVAEVRNYLGREALFIERAMAWLDDAEFGDGVLEYDVAAPVQSGFVGVNFRVANPFNFEQFYVRFHQSGHPDATQYLPVYNGLASWQIHAGPNETGVVSIPAETWIHVKIVTKDDKADIYIGDDTTPLIHVPDLYRDYASGPVAIYAGDRPGMTSGAYFSNFTTRALTSADKIVGKAQEEPTLPDGVIADWRVSQEFSEEQFKDKTSIADMDLDSLDWSELKVERNGVANLAKVSRIDTDANSVLVRKTIRAEEPMKALFQFGYSDRVALYVNGEQIFHGNAGWRVRDHRFLGTIGLNDAIILPLNEGDNELVAIVSESFGGWGFTGQIADQQGLTLE